LSGQKHVTYCYSTVVAAFALQALQTFCEEPLNILHLNDQEVEVRRPNSWTTF